MTTPPPSDRAGLTLLELLIVVAVIALLAGMLMPVLGIVKRAMKRSATEMVLKRTDTALRMFRTDWGVYPTQASYPEPFTGRDFPNRLYYHVGTDISWTADGSGTSPAERVQADMATAESKFDDRNPTPGLTFVVADITSGKTAKNAARLNRMAREQARLAVLAGNLDHRGPVITHGGATLADRRATPILGVGERSSAAAPGPGWAHDYLGGSLEARYRNGDTILDAWGNALVYLCQAVPGVKATNNPGMDTLLMHRNFGLGPMGFDPTTGPAPALVAAGRAKLLYYGRIRLSATDAGDGQPTPTHPTWFPDLADLRHADARYYCPPGQETEFELWSAGPDRAFDYLRDDPDNADNIAAVRYEKELPR